MLVKFFRHGNTGKGKSGRTGGGNSARDYLLGKDGNREGATVIKGDPNTTTEVINGIQNKSIYTSAVLSFSPEESDILTEQQIQDVIADFEKTLFPTFQQDQYSSYWVQHRDKDRLELHCIFANVELRTGKALPVYYHRNDKGLVDSWQNFTNDIYGLDNPKAPKHKQLRTPTKGYELKEGYTSKDGKLSDEALKQQIHDRILGYVEFMPNVNNRDDVVRAIGELGYTVTRANKDISIKNPLGGKNLKFKGELYSKDFNRAMLKDMKSYEQVKWQRDTPNRLARSKADLDRNLEYRIDRMSKRFKNVDRQPLANDLTIDLAQIRAINEPEFFEQVMHDQMQYLNERELSLDLYLDDKELFEVINATPEPPPPPPERPVAPERPVEPQPRLNRIARSKLQRPTPPPPPERPVAPERPVEPPVTTVAPIEPVEPVVTPEPPQPTQRQFYDLDELRKFTARVTLYDYKSDILQDPSIINDVLKIAAYKMKEQNILLTPNDYDPDEVASIDNFAEQVRELQRQQQEKATPEPQQPQVKVAKSVKDLTR